jgi:hypothetical protein
LGCGLADGAVALPCGFLARFVAVVGGLAARAAQLGHGAGACCADWDVLEKRCAMRMRWPCEHGDASDERGNKSGSCRRAHHVRFEAKAWALFMLSVEAMERSVGKKSALLKAGGEVVVVAAVCEPDEDLRRSENRVSGRSCLEEVQEQDIPSSRELWALSLRPKVSLGLPSLLTALDSPRLVVKTFKQTLRGGIS